MRESIDFRFAEETARRLLPRGAGEKLGGVRRVIVERGDPLYEHIKELHAQWPESKRVLFSSATHRWHCSAEELADASMVTIAPSRAFEPVGEECGTRYDESDACGHVFKGEETHNIRGMDLTIGPVTCGVGARQVGPLVLRESSIPKSVDLAQTIAGEVVVSKRFVERCQDGAVQGVRFEPVQGPAGPSSVWFQPCVDASVQLSEQTLAGAHPFDRSHLTRCPRGPVLGLARISPVVVETSQVPELDFSLSRQCFGVRVGVLRPQPILIISSRAWRALAGHGLRGLVAEVVEIQDG